MIAIANLDTAMAEAVSALTRREEPCALATVVRTVGSTAAKPGTKALLSSDGEILSGWLGGGCTRGAVRKAVLAALADGQPRLISVAPEDVLEQQGVSSGQSQDGVHYARNGCASKGTTDVFIEPLLPAPELVIFGTSPVAEALARLAGQFDWDITEVALDGLGPKRKDRWAVVATQGQGDRSALRQAVESGAAYVGFVGSAKKFAVLSETLAHEGCDAEALARVQAPAGLPINAATPEEIALSILAHLTQHRRAGAQADG